MAARVALGLGANKGRPYEAIRHAVEAICACGLRNVECSSYYETDPIDCAPGTAAFVNLAIVGTWPGSPHELLKVAQELETAAGRPVSRAKNSPRSLDIDILLFGNATVVDTRLIIPHPRMISRLFVLYPLAEIAPDWNIPGVEQTVSEMREVLLRSATDPWGYRARCWRGQKERPPSLH